MYGCKSQTSLIGDQNVGRGDKRRRLGDVANSAETVLRSSEVNLHREAQGRSFRGAHDGPAPPFMDTDLFFLIDHITVVFLLCSRD